MLNLHLLHDRNGQSERGSLMLAPANGASICSVVSIQARGITEVQVHRQQEGFVVRRMIKEIRVPRMCACAEVVRTDSQDSATCSY